ncbi:hypothetical protein JST97_07505 [bacterium]|nr:hypothetical protein [bacterium]
MTYPDLIGALLMGFSFLLVWAHPQVSANSQLRWVSFFTLGLHHCAAICNAFFFELRSNLYDATRFHRLAADPNQTANTDYALALKQVYQLFGVSHFLGEEVSVLAYALSIYFFLYLVRSLEVEEHAAGLLLLYGSLPSGVVHCSITLREPFQCFFFLTMVTSAVAFKERPGPWGAAGMLVSLWAIVLLHQALAVYAFLLLLIGLGWVFKDRKDFAVFLFLASMCAGPLLLPRIYNMLLDRSDAFRSVAQGEIGNYTAQYRSVVAGLAESEYGFSLDTSSLGGLLVTLPPVLILYQVAPLPWQIHRYVDLYAFAEVLLRLILFWGVYQNLRQAKPRVREILWFLIISCVGLDCLWALGTANWGTGSRHHLVAYPVWVAMGGSWLLSFQGDRDYRHLLERRRSRTREESESCPA